MSAFIMKQEAISKIATYTADLLNMSYEFFGMCAPSSLYIALSECRNNHGYYEEAKIYNALCQLNINAVNGRYSENYPFSVVGEFKPIKAHKRPEYKGNGQYKLDKWMPEMSKRITCFNYQCCEDATRDAELYKAMVELENVLNAFIVFNMNAWHNIEWGE